MSPLLNEKPSVLLHKYLNDYSQIHHVDTTKALKYIKTNEHFETLTNRWYDELDNNDVNSAYQVYNDEYYFTDIWNCFVQYSRRYLRDIARPCLDNGKSFVEMTQDAKIVVDVGCGIGYSTSVLTELYPNASVYGSNLKNTKQWKFCEMMSSRYGFNMIESVSEIKSEADIVFASEYFEHFESPIEHLNFLTKEISPKYFVIANAFNTRSIGHFNTYKFDNMMIDQSEISKLFNKSLKNLGYERVKTKLFNNKPNIWKKVNTKGILV